MKGTLNIKFIEMNGISPKTIELMVEEVKAPSQTQILSEEVYRLKARNESLEREVAMLREERTRLKKTVKSSIAIIVGTSYESVNEEGKMRLDKFRGQAAEVLKVSDLLGMLIGE